MIILRGRVFAPFKSCPGGTALDEIDTCIYNLLFGLLGQLTRLLKSTEFLRVFKFNQQMNDIRNVKSATNESYTIAYCTC